MNARRRLAGVRIGVVAAAAIVSARLVQVQITQHARFQRIAQDQWTDTVPLAPRRGDLFDREGRPLALSVTSTRIGVSTKLVRDPHRLAEVLAAVLGDDARDIERRILGAGGGHLVLCKQTFLDPKQQEALRRFPAVTIEEQCARIYPRDEVGATLIGYHRGEKNHCGLELGLDATLSGTPGKATRLNSGNPLRSLGEVVVAPADDGDGLVLTLDAELQEICETQLARAVDEFKAIGGSVLVLDPSCGDILAAASWPMPASRRHPITDVAAWTNRNFSFQYEPGSVFKLFTGAALLGRGAIDTATVIDCADGDFGRFRIHEAEGHDYHRLSFMEAFAHSSNVFFARASLHLSADDLYRDLQSFGFGQRTSAPYPTEQSGMLRPVAKWSGRSQPTIAIGQEVSVTPLQLGLAVAAVANGGTLYAPRLVREVRDAEGRRVRECPPVALRRVIPEGVATVLRTAMGRVVEAGTGKKAAQDWIDLGGKTGTAQKAIAGRGYSDGKHVATFVSLVPWQQPRYVMVTVLDEPPGINHFASQSAAPLTGWIVASVRGSTNLLTDLDQTATPLEDDRRPPTGKVPDVLYLDSGLAVASLEGAGLRVLGAQKAGLVVQQVPAPGAACAVGDTVTLDVRAAQPAQDSHLACPDLAGLSNRQVITLASRLGFPVSVDGVGYVGSQEPLPGAPLPVDGLKVKMVSTWQ